MRVVSLLPSATEIVYALGVEPVAVSHECDVPPAALEKPAANRSRVDPDGSSRAVDERVAEAADSGGVYEIDDAVLRAADPDLIVTQGMCDVCAVDSALVEDAVDRLGLDAEIVTTHPHDLDDVLADVRTIGAALGRDERARDLVSDCRDRIDAVREASRGADRPRVAVLDWMAPVMVAGHWVPEIVELAGGAYGLADAGDRSEPRPWGDVLDYDPEVLVAAPCGFPVEQTRSNAPDLADRPGWEDLTAVREGRVFAMDGHGHVNRPGPRLVDTLEALAGLLHPDRFEPPPAAVAGPFPGPTTAGAEGDEGRSESVEGTDRAPTSE